MKPALLDTNILTAFLKGHPQVVAQMERHLDEVGRPSISIITYYELLRGLKELGSPRRLEDFEDLVSHLHVRLLTRRVIGIAADLYVELRRRGEPLEDADILIAATALAHDLVLVTDNEQHFRRIPRLEVENWLHGSKSMSQP
jgi:tRNA(fMet)-specific endonuclease VapC